MNIKLLFLCLILFGINIVYAGNGEPMDVFGEWTVFRTVENRKTFCYMMNIPQNKSSNILKRGEPFFLVIKEKGKRYPEINLSTGFQISNRANSAEIEVNNKLFPLITRYDQAWAYSAENDVSIINLLGKNAIFVVSAFSENGERSVDVYSLLGFSEAYRAINKLCK